MSRLRVINRNLQSFLFLTFQPVVISNLTASRVYHFQNKGKVFIRYFDFEIIKTRLNYSFYNSNQPWSNFNPVKFKFEWKSDYVFWLISDSKNVCFFWSELDFDFFRWNDGWFRGLGYLRYHHRRNHIFGWRWWGLWKLWVFFILRITKLTNI